MLSGALKLPREALAEIAMAAAASMLLKWPKGAASGFGTFSCYIRRRAISAALLVLAGSTPWQKILVAVFIF